MNLRQLASLAAPLFGVSETECYNRGRELIHAGVLPRGPSGHGPDYQAGDVAKYLLSWLASDQAKEAADAVRRLSALPATAYAIDSPFARENFGAAVGALLLLTQRRVLGWQPVAVEVHVTKGTGAIYVKPPGQDVTVIVYGTAPQRAVTWPEPVEVVRRIRGPLIAAVAFGGAEKVPADLRRQLADEADPMAVAAARGSAS